MARTTTTSFTLLLMAVLAALVGVQLVGVEAQRSADRAADHRVALAGGVAQIRYYDELLTMSARLAATTGDTSYVQRHRSAVPELDRALADAVSDVPDAAASDAVDGTDDANQALIALEEQAFDLLAAGDRQGAYAAVSGPDYALLKAEYRTEMDLALKHLERAGASRQAAAEQRQRMSLVVGVTAALLLVGLWTLTARGLRRSQQARGRIEEQLRVQAYADPLTGLANRRQFHEHLAGALQQECRSGPASSPGPAKLAVLFADLDHFKSVNDTRGHAGGDALLVEVAQRLTGLLHGHPGALVARLGGDEFAMLLPHTRDADAEQVADRVVSALARPYAAAPEIPVTASVGLTVGRVDDHDPALLLRGADLAMYDAKSNGRGRWSRHAEHMHTDLLGPRRA